MSIENITPGIAQEWLSKGDSVLLDVRTAGEYASEHIEGAILLTPEEMKGLSARYPGRKLVFQCAAGGRSRNACAAFQKLDPAQTVYNLEGGINAWKHAGLDTVKGSRTLLPLDRQVQLTIGIMLLAATSAGFLVHSYWHVIALFIGVGLTIAGATGFCGLARILACMPWNRAATGTTCSVKR